MLTPDPRYESRTPARREGGSVDRILHATFATRGRTDERQGACPQFVKRTPVTEFMRGKESLNSLPDFELGTWRKEAVITHVKQPEQGDDPPKSARWGHFSETDRPPPRAFRT